MQLGHPQALWLLLLLPFLLFLLRLGLRRQNAFRQCLGDSSTLRCTPFRFPRLHCTWVRVALLAVPFMSVVIALADPQLQRGPLRLPAGVLDVVMLMDVSKSMLAEDYGQKSRLEKARQMARAFLSELQGNRVGLVTFAGTCFRQAELTKDFRALDFILVHWVREESAGVSGSDLAAALETGLALFPLESTRRKVMMVFSDGGTQDATLDRILTKIKHRGVQVTAYGIGSLQPARIPRYDRDRQFLEYLEKDGRVVTTGLNEAPLKRLAKGTNGQYWRVTHQTRQPTLLTSASIPGNLLRRDKRKIFQPFLLVGLLACAAQAFLTRL